MNVISSAATKPLFPDIVVNGEVVPNAAVAAETQNHPAPPGKPGVAWRKAANALAIRTLLLQEAKRREIVADPAELSPGRFETEEEAVIRWLLEEALAVEPPDEATVQAAWEKNPERFRSPPLWEVSHILCSCDPENAAARETAFKRATMITEMAQREPKGFARLAANESDCPSKANGGALGQLGPDDTVPEFEAALKDLTEGAITPEPVLSRHGYHIIRLDGLAEPQVLPYAAVRQTIADALEKAAWTRAARAFVNELVASAQISGVDMKPV